MTLTQSSLDRGHPAEVEAAPRPWWLPVLLVVAAGAVVALDVDVPGLRTVAGLWLVLACPAWLLCSAAPFPDADLPRRVVYAVAAVLGAVMGLGLLLDVLLPLVGVDRPLAPAPLAITAVVGDLALLAWCRRRGTPLGQGWAPVLRRVWLAPFEPAQALASGGVLAAVVGAVRLNNDQGGQLAWLGRALALGAVVVLLVRREAGSSTGRDARVLGLVATSLLLSTSLRGWFVVGHDITAEFLVYDLADHAQRWTMGSFQNAYNACLSITILPTVLHQVTGLGGLVVFKVVLQLVFALVPVATYLFARRFVSRSLAVVAAALTMAFPTFSVDMPYLVRQETAFLFVAALLLAGTSPSRSTRAGRLWVAAFGLGVVLSHYSTTYMLLVGLVLGLVILAAFRVGHRIRPGLVPQRRLGGLALLHPLTVVSLLLASVVWTGPATHTNAFTSDVFSQTVDVLLGRAGETPGSSILSYGLFGGGGPDARDRLDQYVRETLKARDSVPPADLLVAHPGKAELQPAILPSSEVPSTAVGEAVGHVVDPGSLSAALRVAGAALLQLFLLVGVLWALFRRRSSSQIPWEVACLSAGSVGALAVITVLPNLSVQYGVLRAFQQVLLVTAPVVAAGLWLVVRRLGRVARPLLVVVPIGIAAVFTGVLPAVLGSYSPPLALRNDGSYYDRYYVTAGEASASRWLSGVLDRDPGRPVVIADNSVSARVARSTGSLGVARFDSQVYPTALVRGGYVVLQAQTVRKQQATVSYSGDLITYRYPVSDLDRRLDVVYSSPDSRIYR